MHGIFLLLWSWGRAVLILPRISLFYCFFSKTTFCLNLTCSSNLQIFFFCFKMVIHMLKSQPSEPSNAGGKMKAGNYKMSWTIDCYLVHRKQKKKSWWKQTQRIKFWLSTMSNQVGFYSTLWNPVNSTVIVCTAVTEKPWGQGMFLCKYRGYFAVVYDKSLRWDSETVVASTYWWKS